MSDFKVKYTNMEYPEYDAHWRYKSLSEPLLSAELSRLAGATRHLNADIVSFQPCPNPEDRNQDRVVVQDWATKSGTWKFRGVFDGHAGHDTVDWAVERLPTLVKESLDDVTPAIDSVDIQRVSDVLAKSISTLDEELTESLLGLFPDPESIDSLTDQQVRSIVNDPRSGGRNAAIVARCMRGTTVLVSLIDPKNENVWVASLGDCQAVLGIKENNQEWQIDLLSSFHNASDPAEQLRIRSEHTGEAECVKDNRVLGAIAVTRAVGDHLFKLPVVYTKRVFMNAEAGFQFHKSIDDFLDRNITPPYLSNSADIRHARVGSKEACLILCSDGLLDLYKHETTDLNKLAQIWFQVLTELPKEDNGVNLACRLLRHAIGGNDTDQVSRLITVEMSHKWMDDTSIVVQQLS